MNLCVLREGDEVVLSDGTYHNGLIISRVDKVTPKYLFLSDGRKYRKSDGELTQREGGVYYKRTIKGKSLGFIRDVKLDIATRRAIHRVSKCLSDYRKVDNHISGEEILHIMYLLGIEDETQFQLENLIDNKIDD